MSVLFTYPKFQAIDSAGVPLSGGHLHTYILGGAANKATYSDRGLTTPNANPVILDTRGEATVYLARGGYKFILENSLGVEVWSFDNYYGPGELDNLITTLGDIIQGGTSGIPEALTIGSLDQVLTVVSTGKLGYRASFPVRLTNKSGGTVVANDLVIIDSTNDSSVKATTTKGDISSIVIVADVSIADTITGAYYQVGKATVAVQGNVARGNYLMSSTTSKRACDAGSLPDRNGIFAIALDAYAGGGAGSVTALLFGHTLKGFTVGALELYGGAAAPTTERKLLCDGTEISRTTYDTLFETIGTAFGAGDTSTTFNLPDMRQRFPLGKAISGTGSTLGGTGGAIDKTIADHSHTVPNTGWTWANAAGAASDLSVAGTASATDRATAGLATSSAGAVTAFNPPFQAVNYLIRY